MTTVTRALFWVGRLEVKRLAFLGACAVMGLVAALAFFRQPFLVAGIVILALSAWACIEKPVVLPLTYIAFFPLLYTFGTRIPVFGAGSPLSVNVMGACNLLVIGCGGLAMIRWWHRLPLRRLWPILALPGYLLLTIGRSPEPMLSTRNWVAYAVPMYIAVMLAVVRDPRKAIRQVFLALMFGCALSASLGLWDLARWDLTYQFSGMPRIPGGHGYPNTFAMFLALCIVAIIVARRCAVTPAARQTMLFGLGVLFLLIFFTFSRTGWIVLAVSLLTTWWLLKRWAFGFLMLSTITLTLVALEAVPLLIARFQPDSAIYIRFTLARLGWDLFLESPIFGHGVGTFQLISRYAIGVVIERYGVSVGLTPHNDGVRFLVEGGLVGGLLYAGLLLQMARLGLRVYRSGVGDMRGLGIFLMTGAIGTFVFGLGGQGLSYSAPYLFAASGLAAALSDEEPGDAPEGDRSVTTPTDRAQVLAPTE